MVKTPRFRALCVQGFEAGPPTALLAALRERADQVVTGSVSEEADALVLDLGAPCHRAMIEAMPHLRCVAVYGTDVSGVDLAAAAERNVRVINVPGYSDDAVAEFVFAAVLGELRLLPKALAAAATPDCWADGLTGRGVRGRLLGVLGLGRIGRRTAEIARSGFDMRVCCWSRTPKPEVEARLGLVRADLRTVMAEAELIAVHLPLTADTQGVLDAGTVAAIRPGAVVVSTSPRALWDLAALEVAIERGTFTFVTDHGEEWPVAERRRLLAAGARLYPGIGCMTEEAQERKLRLFLEALDGGHEGSGRGNERRHP